MHRIFDMDNPVFSFFSRLADLVILSLVFIISSIPIVTIGAALCAMYYVTLKMVKKEESYIIKSFFRAFKQNFKQSTMLWIINAAVMLLIYFDFRIISQYSGKSFFQFAKIALITVSFVAFSVFLYAYPLLAQFDNSVKNTIKNSFFMALGNLPQTLFMVVISVAAVLATVNNINTFSTGIYIWVFLGFAAFSYLFSFFFAGIFRKYIPKEDLETEELTHIEEIINEITDTEQEMK